MKVKQKEYEELENKCQQKEDEIDILDDTAKVIKDIKATEQQIPKPHKRDFGIEK